MSGTLEDGVQFARPIVLDDMVLGFARLSLVPPSGAPDWMRIGLSALALLTVALLVAFWSYRVRTTTTRTRSASPVDSPPMPTQA